MAAAVRNKAVLLDQTKSIWRLLSFSFTRNYSAATSAAVSSSPATDAASSSLPSPPTKRKYKNLFEVAQFLPNWGIGYHMAKSHWVGVSYKITKINLYKSGNHGKAWGIVHKEGVAPKEAPRRISGSNKRCWRYIADLSKTPSITTQPQPPPEPQSQPHPQAQAA